MEPVIEVRNLERFFGEFQAVKGISFAVKPGEVFGLLGPNGACKSTTLKMLGFIFSFSIKADVILKRDRVIVDNVFMDEQKPNY